MPPNDRIDVSAQGLDFIASFEGFRAQLYNDAAGHATIGIGHLVHKGPINGSEPEEFKRGITRERALQLLKADAGSAVGAVRAAVKVPLNQNEFDALVSFTFNVGGGNFRGSTLLTKLNAGDRQGAAAEFGRWNKAGGKVLTGLTRRRKAEADLFLKGAGAGTATTATTATTQTQDPTGEVDELTRFVKATGTNAVFVTNGIHRRWVQSPAKMAELVKLGVDKNVVVISADGMDDLELIGPAPGE